MPVVDVVVVGQRDESDSFVGRGKERREGGRRERGTDGRESVTLTSSNLTTSLNSLLFLTTNLGVP